MSLYAQYKHNILSHWDSSTKVQTKSQVHSSLSGSLCFISGSQPQPLLHAVVCDRGSTALCRKTLLPFIKMDVAFQVTGSTSAGPCAPVPSTAGRGEVKTSFLLYGQHGNSAGDPWSFELQPWFCITLDWFSDCSNILTPAGWETLPVQRLISQKKRSYRVV